MTSFSVKNFKKWVEASTSAPLRLHPIDFLLEFAAPNYVAFAWQADQVGPRLEPVPQWNVLYIDCPKSGAPRAMRPSLQFS